MRPRVWATAVLLGCVVPAVAVTPLGAPATDEPPGADIYIMFDGTIVWMGDRFHFTLYEPARVEARFNSMLGELLEIYRLGPMQPGQHTLPWNGLYHGESPYAGRYEYELFFDDEYAVSFWFLCRPKEQP